MGVFVKIFIVILEYWNTIYTLALPKVKSMKKNTPPTGSIATPFEEPIPRKKKDIQITYLPERKIKLDSLIIPELVRMGKLPEIKLS